MARSDVTPFARLADYERRSLAHRAGRPAQDAPAGLWKGIGFRIGTWRLASALGDITELMAPPVLTPVPGTRDWLPGIAQIRGSLVPVIDLGRFLFGTAGTPDRRRRVLLVRQPGGRAGLLVDEVFGQQHLTLAQYAQTDAVDDPQLARFVTGTVATPAGRVALFSMRRLVRSADFLQAAL